MSQAKAAPAPKTPKLLGFLAEFNDDEALLEAAAKVRDKGFKQWDCHTPFPVHGLDDAMGMKRSILPWLVFFGGAFGTFNGFLLQSLNAFEAPIAWFNNGYAFVVSGKPPLSVPTNIPIVFELTILFAAITTVLALLVLNGLPMLYHAVFASDRFKKVSTDGFMISVLADDKKFDAVETRAFLESIGGSVEALEGRED